MLTTGKPTAPSHQKQPLADGLRFIAVLMLTAVAKEVAEALCRYLWELLFQARSH